jgi:hypothetical protein
MFVDSLALFLESKGFRARISLGYREGKIAADLILLVFTSNGRSVWHSWSDSSSFVAGKSMSALAGRVGSELLIKSVPTYSKRGPRMLSETTKRRNHNISLLWVRGAEATHGENQAHKTVLRAR